MSLLTPSQLALVLGLALLCPRAASARAAWSHETGGAVWAAPAISRDGRVLVGAEDGFFYGFAPAGRLLWTYKASEGFSGWPILTDGRTVAAANRNGLLYFFSLDGELQDKISLGGVSEGLPVAARGQLYFAVRSGRVVSVRERRLSWYHATGSPVTTWPASDGAGRIYAGCADGSLLALDPAGKRLWRRILGAPLQGQLIAGRAGVLGISLKGELIALNSRGEIRWRKPLGRSVSGLAPMGNGAVVGSEEGVLFALDDAGRIRWRFNADGPIRSVPAVVPAAGLAGVRGSVVIFGTDTGSLYILDEGGRPVALFSASGPVRGGVRLSGRRLFFGSQDRRLYVLPAVAQGAWEGSSALKAALSAASQASLLWRREISGPVAPGVARGAGQTLLAGTWGRKLFALDTSGRMLWTYDCGEDIDSLPATSSTGEILFGCNDGGLYGLKPSGDLRFRFPVGRPIASSPAVARDGTIYFGGGDKRIYALTAEGKVRWRIRTGDEVDGSPRIAPDGVVYIGSDDRHLYALSPIGQILWYYRTGGAVRSRPALGRDGTVYVSSFDQELHAVTPNGGRKWSYQTDGQLSASPVVAADGTIYIGSRDHHLYALSPDGKLRWRFQTAGEVDGEPSLGKDGSIVFGSDDGNLYALDPERRLRWWFPAGAEVRGRVVIDERGQVFLGTMDGGVMALAAPGSPLARRVDRSAAPLLHSRARLGRYGAGPPLVRPDGTILFAGEDGVVRAIDGDGWPRWSVRVGSSSLAPLLAVGEDLITSDARGTLAALRAGRLRLRLRLDRGALTPPAVLHREDGPLILVGSAAGRVWAVTRKGKVRWFWSGPAAISGRPVVIANTVIVGAGREVIGLDQGGQRLWSRSLSAGIVAGPTAAGGAVLLADGLGQVVALSPAGAVLWQRDAGAAVLSLEADRSGSSLVLGTADGRALLLAADGELLLDIPAPSPLTTVALADERRVLLASREGAISTLDRGTGRITRIHELATPLVAATLAPGGVILVSAAGLASYLDFSAR